MLVYCNGDSFTAGVTLCDHIFPHYPGGFTREELKTRSAEIDKFVDIKGQYYRNKYFKYPDLYSGRTDNIEFFDEPAKNRIIVQHGHKTIEKNYTYLAELEKLDPTIETINRASAGASMGGICYRTLLDLMHLKSKNVHVDRVIIQLTSVTRYELFDTNYKHFLLDRPLGFFNLVDKTSENISNAIIARYTNHDYIIKFLYHLLSVSETVLSITGKPLILFDSINGEHIEMFIRNARHHINITNPGSYGEFESLVKLSGIENAHMRLMENVAKNFERPYAYDGHYLNEVHKATAVELLKLL